MIALNEERRLVRRTKAGDQCSFERLERDSRRKVFSYTKGLVPNKHQAEDVYQESLIKAWKKIKKFKGKARFSTWLCVICKNTAFDFFKKQKRQNSQSLDEILNRRTPQELILVKTPSDDLQNKEVRQGAEKLISSLPLRQRKVFEMYAQQQMTYSEISDSLSMPVGTVMSTIFNSRKNLKRLHKLTKEKL